MRSSAGRIFVIASTVLVVAVVLVGIYLTGSPREARVRSLDRQRVEALTRLSAAINAYRYDHNALPPSLDEAARAEPGIAPANLVDPENGAPYAYRATGADKYVLCAVFDGPSEADDEIRWRHGRGRACFDFTAPKRNASPPLAPESVYAQPER